MDNNNNNNNNFVMDEIFIKDTMIYQPLINIGMIGHVANGKSELTRAISGETTQRHSSEKLLNITKHLGYANAKIYKCATCPSPQCYQPAGSSSKNHLCNICCSETELVSHFSFVDCPGHNKFMATMLNGTVVMDCAILVESASNDKIPAPQTIEHFEIVKRANITTAFVCINKLDLFTKRKNEIPEIIKKVRNMVGDTIPIIPISATIGCNIDVVCEYIANIPIPIKNVNDSYKMIIIRSFDANKGITDVKKIIGGIVGGSIIRGMVKLNDKIAIYPGYVKKENNKWTYKPLKSNVLSIKSENNPLEYGIQGGLIGIQLNIDNAFTAHDLLAGQIMYSDNNNNNNNNNNNSKGVYVEIIVNCNTSCIPTDNKTKKFQININSNNVVGSINLIDADHIKILLERPVCLEHGDNITISVVDNFDNLHICCGGTFIEGTPIELLR